VAGGLQVGRDDRSDETAAAEQQQLHRATSIELAAGAAVA
jgi:hypothetical protein